MVQFQISVCIVINIFRKGLFLTFLHNESKSGYGLSIIVMEIWSIIIWLTDFACCDWSIPGP